MKLFFVFQAEDGIRDYKVTGVQTCALPISDVPLRIAVGPPGLRSARRLARPPAPQPTRRALLLLPRSLLRRTLRDRGPQARQLLAGLLPRSAARESRRRAGRRRGSRLGEAPRRVARRALSGRVACDAARA